NVMWSQRDVVFVTINVPGGSNNDADVWYGASSASPAQTDEQASRTGADIRWLDAAFAQAAEQHAKGVVIVTQADMPDLDRDAPGSSDQLRADHRHDRGADNRLRPPGAAVQRRLAPVPLRQPALADRTVRRRDRSRHRDVGLRPRPEQHRLERTPLLQRAELPPGRRAPQHAAARMAQADHRPKRQ